MSNTAIPPQIPMDDELFQGIDKLIKQANESNAIGCDYICRHNQNLDNLYQDYMSWRYLQDEAPEVVQATEQDYYTAAYGTAWYDNFRETNATKEADQIVPIIAQNVEEKHKEISRNIDYYESQQLYIKRMGALIQDYNQKINNDAKDAAALESKMNVNNRLAVYYNMRSDTITPYTNYAYIFYWIVGAILICYVAWGIYKKRITAHSITLLSALSFVSYLAVPFALQTALLRLNATRCT